MQKKLFELFCKTKVSTVFYCNLSSIAVEKVVGQQTEGHTSWIHWLWIDLSPRKNFWTQNFCIVINYLFHHHPFNPAANS